MTSDTRPDSSDDEFYIGYAPPMPPRHAWVVMRVVAALVAGSAVWAGVAAIGHIPLKAGTFNYGHPQTLSGVIVERPYPAIVPDGGQGSRSLLLVGSGKHGANGLVRGLDGRHVRLSGARIERNGATMLELEAGSVIPVPGPLERKESDPTLPAPTTNEVFVGEVVDPKCFLGVMVPGDGKTHADCASLCIRGGIPPAFHVLHADGSGTLMLLTDTAGQPLGAQALQWAGARIQVDGAVEVRNGWRTLKTSVTNWRHVAR